MRAVCCIGAILHPCPFFLSLFLPCSSTSLCSIKPQVTPPETHSLISAGCHNHLSFLYSLFHISTLLFLNFCDVSIGTWGKSLPGGGHKTLVQCLWSPHKQTLLSIPQKNSLTHLWFFFKKWRKCFAPPPICLHEDDTSSLSPSLLHSFISFPALLVLPNYELFRASELWPVKCFWTLNFLCPSELWTSLCFQTNDLFLCVRDIAWGWMTQ